MGNCPEVGGGGSGNDGCGEAGDAKMEEKGESTEASKIQALLWKQLSQNNMRVKGNYPLPCKKI